MSDLISRQAAIEAIENIDPSNSWLNYAADVIKALPSAQRWIPVSEKPRKNGKYLVTKIDHITHERLIDIAHYGDFIHENNGFYKADEVTAWMPLLEPWKGEVECGK